ncbi:MAG TPA: very short patch repair endonuclease [Flavobacteriales bacterium]|nr:very short patch repair endonuclease [Flavobacteriales bacterium]
MPERTYIRDGRAPVPKDERTSAVMSRIRATNTAPERRMRAALAAEGIKGYRLHYTKAPGRPDIAFVGRRIALFVHGCFWHRCPHCDRSAPKSNSSWWRKKLDANHLRDKRKERHLRAAGWRVITVWECRLRANAKSQARRVGRMLDR